MNRWLALAFGIACYLLTGMVTLWTALFLNDWLVSRTVNHGAVIDPAWAAVVDLALIGLFGLQHSVMARAGFKRGWTKLVPPPVERSIYVLFSDLALELVLVLWQPIPGVLWDATETIMYWPILAFAGAGVLVMAVANLQLDHFELFGLRQVGAYFRGRPNVEVPFRTPGLYGYVRHPLMLGLLIALWATPKLTVGRLLFNAGITLYILLALRWEEHDLLQRFGAAYEQYRRRVPTLLPWKWTTT